MLILVNYFKRVVAALKSSSLFCLVSLGLSVQLSACKVATSRPPFPQLSDVCDAFEISEELLTFSVGSNGSAAMGPTLTLPREYFPARKWRGLRNATLDGAVFFQLRLSDFGPLTKMENRASLKMEPSQHILLLVTPPKDLTDTFNSFVYGPLNDGRPQNFTNMSRNEFGLFEVERAKNDRVAYIHHIDNRLTDLIMCERYNSVTFENAPPPNESCAHRMGNQRFRLKITYDSDLLKNWQEYRSQIEALLECQKNLPNPNHLEP